MNSLKKYQLLIVLVAACICLPVLAAEPNEPSEPNEPNSLTTELKFKVNELQTDWRIKIDNVTYTDPGPIKPRYAASFRLHEDYPFRTGENVKGTILLSPISKKLSKEQQEFLETDLAVRVEILRDIPFYTIWTFLYAVSEEDAELMVQAYLDGLYKDVESAISERKQRLSESQQIFEVTQTELSERQKQLEETEREYQNIKNSTYQFTSEGEAVTLAQQKILEIENSLNKLNIELAGIREKVKTAEKYREEEIMGSSTYAKLTEIYVELMIELSGLEARMETTLAIREREGYFLYLYNKLSTLRSQVRGLRNQNDNHTQQIENITDFLAGIPQRRKWQPPRIYENTVTIYPVITGEN